MVADCVGSLHSPRLVWFFDSDSAITSAPIHHGFKRVGQETRPSGMVFDCWRNRVQLEWYPAHPSESRRVPLTGPPASGRPRAPQCPRRSVLWRGRRSRVRIVIRRVSSVLPFSLFPRLAKPSLDDLDLLLERPVVDVRPLPLGRQVLGEVPGVRRVSARRTFENVSC
jgi:hypothetical protein